ncbi:hypothetical protein [Sphingobacterium cavernae]|uniref:hypothetical protein n=1 Tax=Sphingobacterium cavernae TaxID=2592657 RepID=UPI00122FBE56|nr:hypothetical protein [Sphingobacterium cavernae]
MKLLRLYFIGFLLSIEGISCITQLTEEDIAMFFTDNFVAICADLMTNELVQQSILILQA